jgi:SAM-dependent methyltransferase
LGRAMDQPQPPTTPALSFGHVAESYDRGRPSYPREAVEWLVGRRTSTVVELGAGTGKLTDVLLELGHDVLATDPLDEMLQHLLERHPDARVAAAPAEQIPAATRSVDTVVAAQAFHWFDPPGALREIARVLKPEGRVALAWNVRDERVPWVRRLGQIISRSGQDEDPTDTLVSSGLFGYVEQEDFRHWQPLRRPQLRDLVASRSDVAVMDPMARDRVLRKVDELFDEYDRGPDGLLLPYVTRCYRAVVRPRGLIEEPEHSRDLTEAAEAVRAAREAGRDAARTEDDDPATTLIDFR